SSGYSWWCGMRLRTVSVSFTDINGSIGSNGLLRCATLFHFRRILWNSYDASTCFSRLANSAYFRTSPRLATNLHVGKDEKLSQTNDESASDADSHVMIIFRFLPADFHVHSLHDALSCIALNHSFIQKNVER
ncbi:hypothetical protein PFISCL1PPCAC_5103, partial [Pristionchus fissidentatus]